MQLRLASCIALLLTACSADAAKEAAPEKAAAAEKAGEEKSEAEAEPEADAKAEAEPEAPAGGGLTVVELKFDAAADLPALLAAEVGKAKEKGQRPYVEFWADWCGPCKRLEASMDDERMKKAFDGVYLVRANSDDWGEKATAAGYGVGSIPVFYEVGAEGKPNGRTISGGAWAEDIPENMAPPLDAFFHGS
jgi:thiol-disulfide isomerase/thioredoxin